MLRSGEVKTVKVHDFVPHRYETMQELLLGVLTSVDFRQGPELGVGPKIRSTHVAVHFSSPVLRSRPSNTSRASDTAFHVVPMSSRFMKKPLVRASGY